MVEVRFCESCDREELDLKDLNEESNIRTFFGNSLHNVLISHPRAGRCDGGCSTCGGGGGGGDCGD